MELYYQLHHCQLSDAVLWEAEPGGANWVNVIFHPKINLKRSEFLTLLFMVGFFFFCHAVTDYDDLVVPLRKHCPAALNVPNNAGVTPHELLQGLSFKQV